MQASRLVGSLASSEINGTALAWERLALLLVMIGTTEVRAEPADARDHDMSWSLLSRNYFLHNDFRSPTRSGQSYRQEWAQGFIAEIESGFTTGAIGLGVDAHCFLGIKLDGGQGHAGTGLLAC